VPLRNAWSNFESRSAGRTELRMKNESYITRRLFLQSTGALIIGVASHAPGLGQPAATLPSNLSRNPDLDTWIQINADGSVSISSGKCEIGQGIRTALAQIVADELDVAIERIQMRDVDTTHSPNEGATTGSNSIKDSVWLASKRKPWRECPASR
jgi:hypothetical protein